MAATGTPQGPAAPEEHPPGGLRRHHDGEIQRRPSLKTSTPPGAFLGRRKTMGGAGHIHHPHRGEPRPPHAANRPTPAGCPLPLRGKRIPDELEGEAGEV